MTTIRPLVAGNWKMHGLAASLAELLALKDRLVESPVRETDIMVCPPATLLAQARYGLRGSNIELGAQDCHPLAEGAYTGDISGEMLRDAGGSYSSSATRSGAPSTAERRARQPEARGALRAGLTPSSASARPRTRSEAARP